MVLHSQLEDHKEQFSNVETVVQNDEEEGDSETAKLLTGIERR